MAFIGGTLTGTGGLNVFSGSLSAFSVGMRRLSCKRLRMVMALLQRRIKTLGSGFLGRIRNANKIKKLKIRYRLVKSHYKRKCVEQGGTGTTGTTTGMDNNWWRIFVKPGMGRAQMRKLMLCVKRATQKFPMPSGPGWMAAAQKIVTLNKRRAYVRRCLKPATPGGGFIGGNWWNASAPLGTADPIVTNTTPPPPSNATIPGQPYTSIPRPGRPVRPGRPNTNWGTIFPMPQPVAQVPYHRHSIFDFEIKTGGPTRQKYYNPGYPPVLPPPRPIIPTPVKPGVRPGLSPGRPDLPAVPATRNFGGDTTSWQDDLPTG